MNLPFNTDLRGKVAAVTGGSGILCGSMAKALGACGAKVAVLGRRLEATSKVADEINAAGGVAKGFICNVLDKDSLVAANEAIEAAFGPIDILINGAGGNDPKGTTSKEFLFPEDMTEVHEGVRTFFDLDPDSVQSVFNLNFIGTLLPTQIFAKSMAARGSGVVINISSMNAFKPLTKIPAYSAAKAAVSNFTQWLAVHMAKVGVRVNAIAPGFFLSEQNRALLTNPDGSLTDRGGKIMSHTPMNRFGTPDDLVGTLLWLVNDQAAAFVTGTVIPVDGGFSAFSGI